mmetsp:Transcript_118225/g.294982  ORF Transcript_118225/g.294982 Transcript_118225/m.294982 type:complete len:244 (+) Transcript_118225:358-1089(+)
MCSLIIRPVSHAFTETSLSRQRACKLGRQVAVTSFWHAQRPKERKKLYSTCAGGCRRCSLTSTVPRLFARPLLLGTSWHGSVAEHKVHRKLVLPGGALHGSAWTRLCGRPSRFGALLRASHAPALGTKSWQWRLLLWNSKHLLRSPCLCAPCSVRGHEHQKRHEASRGDALVWAMLVPWTQAATDVCPRSTTDKLSKEQAWPQGPVVSCTIGGQALRYHEAGARLCMPVAAYCERCTAVVPRS